MYCLIKDKAMLTGEQLGAAIRVAIEKRVFPKSRLPRTSGSNRRPFRTGSIVGPSEKRSCQSYGRTLQMSSGQNTGACPAQKLHTRLMGSCNPKFPWAA